MSRKGALNQLKADQIADEIRTELRSIMRARQDLSEPLSRFEPITENGTTRYYVVFDLNKRRAIEGMAFGAHKLKLPDERITDRAFDLAKSIWQLKDRLNQYAVATNQEYDLKRALLPQCPLSIAADLANSKKHGRCENLSGLNPRLDLVTFDTRESGGLRLYYNGATREKELIVSNPTPIAFSIEVMGGNPETIFGDAVSILNQAFRDRVSETNGLGILSGNDPRSEALREMLLTNGDIQS